MSVTFDQKSERLLKNLLFELCLYQSVAWIAEVLKSKCLIGYSAL